jgi:hypothetical protein
MKTLSCVLSMFYALLPIVRGRKKTNKEEITVTRKKSLS